MRLNELVEDPSPILPILEALKNDPREEVRRSVANNLNDISKDHPDLVVSTLKDWQKPDDTERSRLIKHALRTLLKAGHPDALELLGFSSQPEIQVKKVQVEPSTIALGGEVTFSFDIKSLGKESQKLMVDYVVHFMKANGKHTPKVFKLKQIILEPGELVSIKRKHGFQPISTRKYYPGIHYLQPQINGKMYHKARLEILPPNS
jgi:hypothetical protein